MLTVLAYLDPGSTDSGTTLGSILLIVGIVLVALVLLGVTIYAAVRLATRRRSST